METNMIPRSILSNLASLRRRERLLTFAWGAACFFAVAVISLLACAFLDWLIDREQETPWEVRQLFFFVQLGIWAVAGVLFILVPQIRRLPDELLALWVEGKHRRFDHRLISAVQFNRPGADLAGMSPELVGVVTKEAQQEARQVSFAGLADHRRLSLAAIIACPALMLIALPLAAFPQLSLALLARQALQDVEVPHSVELADESPKVWPIGDSITIRYRVKGEWHADMIGTLTVRPLDGRPDRYPLEFIKTDGPDAIFGVTDVKPSSVNILYSARLADGRTRHPSEMKLAPRPVVMKNEAWVLLPEFCGLRPDGSRFEIPQPRGDVIGIPGSKVRVQFEVARRDHQAFIELLGPEKIDAKPGTEEATFAEVPKGEPIKMKIRSAGFREFEDEDKIKHKDEIFLAEKIFDLAPGLTGYRLIVKDENGFENVPRPRRALRLVPEDPPQVTLLRDSFGENGTFDVEGMPVPLGKKIRIPYVCFGAYGLGKAQVLYRLIREHESGKEPAEEEPWVRAPLPEVRPDASAGPFDLKTGVFQNTPDGAAVPFHAVPSADPRQLGRTSGGGRVLLSTNGLIDAKGLPRTLKSGDKIEYCIEVFAQLRDPKIGETPAARSETRVVTVMDEKAFLAWFKELQDEDQRVKDLEKKQRGVFERK